MKRNFILTRETKGALLYTELAANGQPSKGTPEEMLTTVYLRKSAFATKDHWPKAFTLTLEPSVAKPWTSKEIAESIG